MIDYSVKIGGEAGQGVQTVSDSLSRVFLRSGFQVFTIKDYQSRIRGGHSFTQIRFSDGPLSAMCRRVDLLVCLDQETYVEHSEEIEPDGVIIGVFDYQQSKTQAKTIFPVDFEQIAKDMGNRIYANIVAVGSVLGILGFGIENMESSLSAIFSKKGDQVIEENTRALRKGYETSRELFQTPLFGDTPSNSQDSNMLLSGNDALGLGAIVGGCTFYSAYPMTPSSGILNFVASRAKEYGILVEQAEDEIAAVNMAVGASYCGARSITGTSGGGFCLMTEGLGLAAMTETPLVIINAQRPGPSTGLPTRTSQSDLEFVLSASHDEFPRIVLSPGDPLEAMNSIIRALNLADRFQVPVIVMSDQYLADTEWTVPELFLNEKADEPKTVLARGDYRRYALGDGYFSPRALPGSGEGLVLADSDEHDEWGHITEDLSIRVAMQKKRMGKLATIKQAMRAPHQQPGDDVTLIGWGSTYGVISEVRSILQKEGISAGQVHFTDLFPLPEKTLEMVTVLPNPIVIEGNYLGQLARLLKRESGQPFPKRINSFNGLPFYVEELAEEVKEVLS